MDANKWWESYGLRYAVGSVTGAVFFYCLCQVSGPILGPLLFSIGKSRIDTAGLLLLGVFGLAYCYIASAPILVMHAGRVFIEYKATKKSLIRAIALVAIAALTSSIFIYSLVPPGTEARHILWPISFLFVYFWSSSILVIVLTIYKNDEVISFYRRVSAMRLQEGSDLVDSYKHLREHGNAFFIIWVEIIFGLCIYSILSLPEMTNGLVGDSQVRLALVMFIFIWIAPSALIWFVGSYIERQLATAASSKQTP